jgi:signal transduction histidine kinase
VVTTVREGDDTVELTVDDDGPGIPVDARAHVFERFTRLDEARSRADGGAGLGLAIVHAIVDAHRGSIAIEDSPLGGARVVVRLPASTRASEPLLSGG